MQPQNLGLFDEDADRLRRSVHDIAAAIISIRALAEGLADHVPMLVAMSRSKYSSPSTLIPQKTLDSLPAIPGEIVELCEIAREALLAMDHRVGGTERVGIPSADSLPNGRPESPVDEVDTVGATVLLVEDEDTVSYVISQTLKAQGCRVTCVSDGKEALKSLGEQNFDLVLMDLRMPGMSGCETAKRIRQRESAEDGHTRIIGLTASPLLEDQKRAMAAGMDAVLVKPIDETTLQSILRSLQPG